MTVALIVGGGLVLWLFAMSKASASQSNFQQGAIDISSIPTQSGSISLTNPNRSNLVRALALGIARGEGYYRAGTVPNRQNNPGDIAVGNSIGTFLPDSIDNRQQGGGWNVLFQQLNIILNGSSSYYDLSMSLTDFANTWTNDGYGTPELSSWLNSVISSLKSYGYSVDESTTLASLVRGDFSSPDQAPGALASVPDDIGSQLAQLSDAGVI